MESKSPGAQAQFLPTSSVGETVGPHFAFYFGRTRPLGISDADLHWKGRDWE